MSKESSLNTEIEEQLQLLAGDIFIQLEDRFTQLAIKIKDEANVHSNAALEQQKHELEEKFTAVHQKLSQSKHNTVNLKYSEIEQLKQRIIRYETKYDSLKEKLIKAELSVKERLAAEEAYQSEIKLVKDNREILQNQLEPLNKFKIELSKENSKLSADLVKLKDQHQLLQETSKHELAQLKANIAEQSETHQAVITEQKELAKSLKALDVKLAKTEKALQTKSDTLKNVEKENKTKIDALIKQHQERLDIYEKASGSTSNSIKTIEDQLNTAQQENTELLSENDSLSAQLAEQSTKTTELLDQLSVTKQEHKARVTDLTKTHKSEVVEIEKSLKIKQKEIDKHLITIKKAQDKDKTQRENITLQKKEVTTLNKTITGLNKSLETINTTHQKALKKQEQDFKDQLDNLASSNKTVEKKANSSVEQLEQTNDENTTLKKQLADLISEHDTKVKTIEMQHQVKVDGIKAQLNTQKDEVIKLNDKLNNLNQSLNTEQKNQRDIELEFEERLKHDTASLNERITDLRNSLNTSDKKQKSLFTDNLSKQEKLDANQQRIIEISKQNQKNNEALLEIRARSTAELTRATEQHKVEIQRLSKEKQAESEAQSKKVEMLIDEATKATNALNNHKDRADVIINKLNTDKDTLQNLYDDLKQETSSSVSEITSLKRQVELEQIRFTGFIEQNAKLKSKQDLSDDQIRQTLKDLRDENKDLKQRLNDEIAELQSSLTEYRLKFEYAQKQIALS